MPTAEDGTVAAPAGMKFDSETNYSGMDLEQAVAQKRVITIWGEENGGIAANQNEYSFGNGATGLIGIPVLGDWDLYGVTVDIEVSSGNLPTLAVMDYTAGSNTVLYQFTMTANPHAEFLTTPVAVPSGTVVGFRSITMNGGTHTDVRICAWLEQ